MSDRAVSPVLGIVLLLLVTAALVGAVGSAALGFSMPSRPSTAAIELRADAGANRLTFVHRGGHALDVRYLTVRVRVDGVPLDDQPPVPFFSAAGFRPGPTGPFNSADDSRWTPGETATLRLAGTNDPDLTSGARVTVTLAENGTVVARADATVR